MNAQADTPDGYTIIYLVRYDRLTIHDCDVPLIHTDERSFGSYAVAVAAAVESGYRRFQVDRVYLQMRGR